MWALECNNAVKSFYEAENNGKHSLFSRPKKKEIFAVNRVSFQVDKGETFGILGQNGSGKSTLIRLISTLLLADEGEIKVFGHNVLDERLEVRRLINRVSVDAAFFKKLSAWENLLYAARLYGLNVEEAKQRSLEILERLGLGAEKFNSPLENLSRGQQQKVAVARALLTSPVLLLLDEPTTGLDPRSKRDVQDFIVEVQREHDATILLTSHDMYEVEKLCDRVAILHEGRLVAMDTPENLKSKYGETEDSSLEDVFFTLTGMDWKEVLEDVE